MRSSFFSGASDPAAQARGCVDALGLLQQDPQAWFQGGSASVDVARIEALMAERAEVRKARNFARSDEIRNELTALGVVIEDTPQGARWKLGG